MFTRVRPTKTITISGGNSASGTGYFGMQVVDKHPSEWTESERDFMAGRDPKTARLERRIAELEAALRGLLNYADRFADKPHVAVAAEIHAARAALKKS